MRLISRLVRDRRAATAIEYGLLVALIGISIIASVALFTETTIGLWSNISNAVTEAQK